MMKEPAMAGSMSPPVGEKPEPTTSEASEKTSVFIPRDALGDRQCKAGEKLTFTVKDVDPETGEVEAMVEGYDEKKPEPSSGVSEAIDAMPEDA